MERIIVQSRRGRTVVCGSRRDGGSVSCVNLILVVGHKANMCRTAVRYAITKPEKQATVCTEAFEIWVSLSTKVSVWHHPSGCTEYSRAFIDPNPATTPRSRLMPPVVVRGSTSE